MKRVLISIATVMMLCLVSASVRSTLAFAATTPAADNFSGDCANGGVKVSVGINQGDHCVGSSSENPIYAYLRGIIKWATGLIGVIIALALVIAGYQWMTSEGQPARLAKAKTRIFNAVISLILFILMAGILRYLVPGVFS